MNLNEYGREIFMIAEDHGFHNHIDARTAYKVMKLALISTEVSEAIEELRNGDSKAHAKEVADIIIRALDYAYEIGMNIDQVVFDKIERNRSRAYKHNKEF